MSKVHKVKIYRGSEDQIPNCVQVSGSIITDVLAVRSSKLPNL